MSPARRSPGRLLRRRIPLPSRCGPLQVAVAAAAVFPLFPAVPQALSQGIRSKVGLAPYGREKSPPGAREMFGGGKEGEVGFVPRQERVEFRADQLGPCFFFFFFLIIPSFFRGWATRL